MHVRLDWTGLDWTGLEPFLLYIFAWVMYLLAFVVQVRDLWLLDGWMRWWMVGVGVEVGRRG